MADHRFSEFHCNRLPTKPSDVAVVANETNGTATIQHAATTNGGSVDWAVRQQVIPSDNPAPIGVGPIEPDKATGEILVKDCRKALGMEPQ